MKARVLSFLLLFALLSISSCKKRAANPKEVLPAATMEGKNTFGAMVNGKVWVPAGRPSTFQKNLDITYEPAYKGGTLNIAAYRKINDTSGYEQLVIGMTQVDHEGVYNFGNADFSEIRFYNGVCEYDSSPNFNYQGKLEVTKLDLNKGVIAGKFEFTLTKSDCETINVTEGRFDKKLF